MARLFLVRHGEASATWSVDADPGLSAVGLAQGEDVARTLAGVLSDDVRLISSPLKRARETMAPLARALDIPVSVSRDFREIPTPVPLAQRQSWLRQFMRRRWEHQDDTLFAWRDGLLGAATALQGDSVIFTHFLVINTIVGFAMERSETLIFWPDNGSITELRSGRGRLEVVSLGREMQGVVT